MTVHPRISTQALASGGYLPTAVLNHVALCGWSPHGGAAGEEGPEGEAELLSLDEMVERFAAQQARAELS